MREVSASGIDSGSPSIVLKVSTGMVDQLDGNKIEIFFNDSGSPALIKDPSDFDSIFVVMPMKG